MNLAHTLDTLLDRTIAPGYGSAGLAVRRRLPDWPPDPPRIDGRAVLVTGAASGIGLAACVGFARLGAIVYPVGRSQERAAEAAEQVRGEVPGADIRPVACDVSDLGDVRGFAERFARESDRLDVLVNNAGVMPPERSHSADGHELMFSTHVLGTFALTAALRELLERSTPSRVINVSSGGMYGQKIPGDDLESAHTEYGPQKLYARTKREQVVITEQWAQRLRGSGVVVHAMHPGWVDTTGVQESMPVFRAVVRTIIRTPAQGADTIVWLGAAPEPLRSTGGFWSDRRGRPTHYRFGAAEDSAADRQKLWDLCQSLVENAGISLGPEAAARGGDGDPGPLLSGPADDPRPETPGSRRA
ncbi:MAG: SDR family NAD(P)-dependent oxidoreductase [Solirubrobacteraceae bacterium]